MITASEIRQQFFDFFRKKGHEIVPSAPIVIKDDPTLLFTNAGMNQFKDYFLGNKTPGHLRVADTQKCLRVSGKHNDLEEVGIDTYHHTMFEMLGNWSFGDYFKKEAIAWGWELLTEVYKIPVDRLYVTVFEGDESEKLLPDDEALQYWKQHIAEDRILFGNKKDNFWEMGDTGPCGPCTEIHVDCRPEEERRQKEGRVLVNAGHPQVIEIWNIVFMQLNRRKDQKLLPLPATHVDTGMGLERLVRVLQHKASNYDTDLFMPIINRVEVLTDRHYGNDETTDIAFRVIADHIRAICFTIADGQLPSNNGAGYVVRRILRRAVRYYFSFLGIKKPLLHELVSGLATQFAEVFPELKKQETFVTKVIFEEENNFLHTLESGIRRLEDYFPSCPDKRVIDGKTAFELYDTFGFPLDLTRLMAREKQFDIDEKGFEVEMQRQKSRSRAATALDTDDWSVLKEGASATFVGYEDLLVHTQVTRYRKVRTKGKEQYQLVLETTPFYAESGGQVGDTGVLDFDGEKISVTDTKKENDLIIHFVAKLPQNISAPVIAAVDAEKRLYTSYNHSATHLLHAALRKVLGIHVQQMGSLVCDEYLRFDFSHFAKLTEKELREIEFMVNDKVRENIPVLTRQVPKEEALKSGAMALFGEKYGDVVRMVTMDPAYSVELCGGTHVLSTGMIGLFKIRSEAATAAGVRRIEALTGRFAINYTYEQLQALKSITNNLKSNDPIKAIETLLLTKNELEKKVAGMEQQQLHQLAGQLIKQAVVINDISFVGSMVDVSNADALRQLCFELKAHFDRYLFILTANVNGKAQVCIMLDENTIAERGLEASAIIKKQVAPLIKGGGGGQKSFASAGGQDINHLQEVVEKVKSLLE